jgi:RimJ/RimL family protein N-acetyltransferase
MNIREVMESDAECFGLLIQEVESSTNFMLFGPGEREINPERQLNMIRSFKEEPNSTIFVCECEKELVGYLIAKGGFAERNRHSAYLVIGILEKYRGKGIGTSLFEKLHKWANEKQIHRLELTVMAHNVHAIALYKKMGFEVEGTKRNSLKINNEYVDEYFMSMLL